MKKFLYLAAAITVMASCTSNDYLGEVNPNGTELNDGAIRFGFDMQRFTRADIYGPAAAELLGNHFYVTGTKGTEEDENPTTNIVFDNYLVRYGVNTAETTTSNSANWEYVGVVPGTAPDENYVKLSAPGIGTQSIKYWDYEADQYDFLAFSTGTYKAVSSTSPAADEIGVTAMKYGADLANSAVAYTFTLPSVDALKSTYFTDITEVLRENYGKEVQLKFKNLGSKVRIALYETIPGYSVKDVQFYALDGTSNFTDANKNGTAKLISANTNGLPIKGTVEVYFPHVGVNNSPEATSPNTPKVDYDKAATTVTAATTGGSSKTQTFGELTAQLTGRELDEASSNIYLGRTLPQATFAGDAKANFYQAVFPVSSSDPLTLRVDYTLVSTDGSGETIKVWGAKAVVPATYTKWLPNYAYTYIFKISDNTNGWTKQTVGTTPAGLFPITFDAVVAEATDANAEQTTITTVATPSITTYQQNHNPLKPENEYSIATGKKVYVQVMDNSAVPATLVTNLSATNSLLYAVSDADATEAEVMNALGKRTTAIDADDVTGRNGITLTKNSNIVNNVTSIVNGVDDNAITVASGSAGAIDITALSAGTYAYVYDYSTSDPKITVNVYEPITPGTTTVGESTKTYYTLTTTALDAISETTANDEAVNNAYIYFSKTTNGGATTTYSYVSVSGKTKLPAGLIKVAKSTITSSVSGSAAPAANTFYFDIYTTNDGKYAVKVIKVVA